MGRIITQKRGDYWEYKFEVAKIDDSRKRVSKSGFKTKEQALAAGSKAQAEYNDAGLSFTPSEIGFSDFLDHWVESYCLINLKTSTVANYKKKIRLHIKPALGSYKLKALTPPVMQRFINKMAKANYSRTTLAVIKGILTGSLSYAVMQEMIRYSPMNNVSLPSPRNETLKPRTAPHVFIPKNRIDQIFDRFPEETSTHIPLMLGYKAGLRLGEAFGCTWDSVSFENSTIRVGRQVQWDEKLKVWYFSAPKYESYRTIDLAKQCMELLRREKERQDVARLYYGQRYTLIYVNEDNHLNTNGDGEPVELVCIRENGEFVIPRSMQHTSSIIHHRLDYPEFDFHSLRHTHATMLAENDAPPKYLQKRMGHKTLEVTMRFYLHLTEKMEVKGANVLQTMFGDD